MVAARKKKQKEQEFALLVVGGGAVAIFGAIGVWNLIRDTKTALSIATEDRELQPWERYGG